MKIYAVTDGEYSDYHIIALTVNKEHADKIAMLYGADIEEYDDAQVYPVVQMWVYFEGIVNGEKLEGVCYKEYPRAFGRNESVEMRGSPGKIGATIAHVYATDEAHARKKAQDMIAQYKAEKEGIT